MEALPSFLGHKDVVVDVPELGKVKRRFFFQDMFLTTSFRLQWTWLLGACGML